MNKAGFMKDALILFVITLVSGCLLGGVYQVTKEPIEKATIAANNKAYKAVFNEAESFEPDDALTAAVEGCNADLAGMDFGGVKVENVLKAVDGSGSQLGYVITSLSKMGNADDTQINAISGATITSSATTNAVNAALYYLHNCIK